MVLPLALKKCLIFNLVLYSAFAFWLLCFHRSLISCFLLSNPIFFFGTDMGVERCVRLDGLTEAQISKKLEELVKAGAALKA